MIEIEKGVPLPSDERGRAAKYPWAEMEIGDSFFLKDGSSSSISGAASNAGKRLGFKFSTREMDDGVRVWRIA